MSEEGIVHIIIFKVLIQSLKGYELYRMFKNSIQITIFSFLHNNCPIEEKQNQNSLYIFVMKNHLLRYYNAQIISLIVLR